MDVRIRHSRGRKRATLVTIREGAHVCFGIARCNSAKGDRFDRATGRFIAQARAEKELDALKEWEALRSVGTIVSLIPGLTIHTSGLRGRCTLESIHQLLDYFRNIHKSQFVMTQASFNPWDEIAASEYLGSPVDEDPCDTCPGCNTCSPNMRGRLG
jgi:hypothetical protein